MATKKTPVVQEQKSYAKQGLAEFLKKKAAEAPANVKRSKTQILIDDHGEVLQELKSKGYSAKQIAELINEADQGIVVSEAAVRSVFAAIADPLKINAMMKAADKASGDTSKPAAAVVKK